MRAVAAKLVLSGCKAELTCACTGGASPRSMAPPGARVGAPTSGKFAYLCQY